MSKEINGYAPTGITAYAQVISPTGQPWNASGTPAFEAMQSAHWTSYALAMSEAATATGFFTADLPAGITASLIYGVVMFHQIGGSPATTDPVIATGVIDMTGGGGGSLDDYVEAYIRGNVVVTSTGAFEFHDVTDPTIVRMRFDPLALPGGRTVTLDP